MEVDSSGLGKMTLDGVKQNAAINLVPSSKLANCLHFCQSIVLLDSLFTVTSYHEREKKTSHNVEENIVNERTTTMQAWLAIVVIFPFHLENS